MVAVEVYLKIAGISIRLKSRFSLKPFPVERLNRGYLHFVLKKPVKNPDIDLQLEIVNKLPVYKKKTILFQTKRDEKELGINLRSRGKRRSVVIWEISRVGGRYMLSGGASGRREYSVDLGPDFKSGIAFVMPEGRLGKIDKWNLTQVTHGFLQILLIHYLAYHRKGIMMHAVGVKDGLSGDLFFGPTQSGKSTMARIWHRNTQAVILNDDRIAMTKKGKRFFIHGTPWNGDFRDYTPMQAGSAALGAAFFLDGHTVQNQARTIFHTELFSALFPQTLSVFWDKSSADFISGFLMDMARHVMCYHLKFADNEEIVNYVRSLRKNRSFEPALRI